MGLQGERKGQENLKNDCPQDKNVGIRSQTRKVCSTFHFLNFLIQLNYFLFPSFFRAKYHKLKFGTELQQGEVKPPIFDDGINEAVDGESIFITNSNVNWRQGRQLLRQYLQEIGYTDMIIDVRSNRVRSLLGLNSGVNVDKEDSGA